MQKKAPTHNHIYNFNYNHHHNELCKLEARQIFEKEATGKMLFSNIKVDPSISPFIKNRFDIITCSADYSDLLKKIKEENIRTVGFKIEYLKLEGDARDNNEKLEKSRDVGFCIEAEPDYYTPTIIYSICNYDGIWYFGILIKNNPAWQKHKKKPCSFSNSLSMELAKTLVSISSKGKKTKQLLDACCGAGTVLLEACYSGFNIEGCDINWKNYNNSRENLKHFSYTANLYCLDIKDHDKKYDAAIIDLPYNLRSYSNASISSNIIESTVRLADRIVIVSISDIKSTIEKSGLEIIDSCIVVKKGKSNFKRIIWVCEK